MITLKKNVIKYKDTDGSMKDIGAIIGKETTDTSLSLSGVAADAQATGKEIENLESSIDEHKDDDEIHVTAVQKQTWDNKSNFSGKYEDLIGQPNIPTTASDIGADEFGTAERKVSTHNTSETSHNDIRLLVRDLSNALNHFLDIDDTTKDQASELIAMIEDNSDLISQITNNKVSVTDIIDNLTTSVSNKPLSAKQGAVLKGLIDNIVVPTLLSQLSEDANHRLVADTQIAAWNAKSNFSGKYADLTGKPTIPTKMSQLEQDIELNAGEDYDLILFCEYPFNVESCEYIYVEYNNHNNILDAYNKAYRNEPVNIIMRSSDGECTAKAVFAYADSDVFTIGFELSDYYTGEKFSVIIKIEGDQVDNGLRGYVGDVSIKRFATKEEVSQLEEQIADHKDDTTSHVTSAEKQVWNNKVDASQLPTIVQEAGESETSVMSQKAVTKLVEETLAEAEKVEYETVDSVDKMTDTSKSYILKSTGTLWVYEETTVTVKPTNKLVASTVTLNQRMSGSSGSVSANSTSVGSFVTDYIPISNMDNITPFNVRLNWELKASEDNKVLYYNSSKTRLSNNVFGTTGANSTVLNGETVLDLKTMHQGTTAPTWADVAYIRLQLFVKPIGTSLTSADVADKTITFEHEGGTKTEYAWTDTGITPSASGGSNGGNYVTLLAKVNKNTSDITEVSNRVTSLETGSETLTIPSFWQSAVDECIAKIKALQIGRNCITFPFFSDNHQRIGYSGMLIAYIMKECNIPYAFFGGDSIDSGYIASEAVMIEQDRKFDTAMSYIPNGRFCRAVGNHDGYWAVDANNKNYYTDAQNYELFLREESIAQNKHFGGDGTYYYVDDVSSKVRFIVLDTNDGTVETEQITWLQNVALKFNESGWGVVFISHQPISNHYHANISNAEAVRTIVKNHANGTDTNKAVVIGWFSGHIHRDRMWTGVATNTTDDSQGTAMGFTQVTITSDHTSIAYDDATKHTVANDDKSHAIDFVTINKNTRTVNITRLGIGSDRSYTY